MIEKDLMLVSGFLYCAEKYTDCIALEIADVELTFQALHDTGQYYAGTVLRNLPRNGPPLTTVFADRSTTAFCANFSAA